MMCQEDVYVHLEFFIFTLQLFPGHSTLAYLHNFLSFFLTFQEQFGIPKYVCICDLPLKRVHLNRRYLIEEMVLSFPAANTWILSGVVCTAFLHAVTTRLSLHTQTPGCVQKTFVLIYHI